jgi:hypothetical protein
MGVRAEDQPNQLGPAGADESGDPEDVAGADGETRMLDDPWQRHILDAQ